MKQSKEELEFYNNLLRYQEGKLTKLELWQSLFKEEMAKVIGELSEIIENGVRHEWYIEEIYAKLEEMREKLK